MRRIAATVAACAGMAVCGMLVAGPLNPPAGAVSSTYRTLSEVEPRTPIGAATTPGDASSMFRITQPGHYYLTGNVSMNAQMTGIWVQASNVTVDLNGFTIDASSAANSAAVRLHPDASIVRVRNGTITNGMGDAVSQLNGEGSQVTVEDLVIHDMGGYGLRLDGSHTIVRRVHVYVTGNTGMQVRSQSRIEDSRVSAAGLNGGPGMQVGAMSTVERCQVLSSGASASLPAMRLGFDSVLRASVVTARSGVLAAVVAESDCVVEDCRIETDSATGVGIVVDGDGVVIRGNTIVGGDIGASGNGLTGIRYEPSDNVTGSLIEGNSIKRYGVGVSLGGRFDHTIIRNRFVDCTSTFTGANSATNVIGPVVTNGGAATNPMSNISQ